MTDPRRLVRGFLDLFQADLEADRTRSLREYLDLFPGAEEAVAYEYFAVHDSGFAIKPSAGDAILGQEAGEVDHGSSGPRLGSYRILEEVGRGGMAVVYRAEDTQLDRPVALKLLQGVAAVSDIAVERLLREARAAGRLDHPGICPIYQAGVEDGVPFIAMRFVDGESLAERLTRARRHAEDSPASAFRILGGQDGPFNEVEKPGTDPTIRTELFRIIAMLEKVARALQAAHESGVVHRDIKPGNILLTKDGEPLVTDFGIASLEEADAVTLTRTGDLFGTPAYMAPEQIAAGRKPVDARADIWALGITLYECLTLRRPFEGVTSAGLLQQIVEQEPADPRRYNAAIPVDLATVTLTALQKSPDQRFHSALDFAEELRRVRSFEPIRSRPISQWVRVARWAQRSPALAGAVLSAVVILIVGTIVSTVFALRAERVLVQAKEAQGLADERLIKAQKAQVLADTRFADQLSLAGQTFWERGEHHQASLYMAEAVRLAGADDWVERTRYQEFSKSTLCILEATWDDGTLRDAETVCQGGGLLLLSGHSAILHSGQHGSGHTQIEGVETIAVNAAGDRALIGYVDGTLHYFDVSDSRFAEIRTWRVGSPGSIRVARFAPGDVVGFVGTSSSLAMIRLDDPDRIVSWPAEEPIVDAAAGVDAQMVLVVGESGTTHVLRMVDGRFSASPSRLTHRPAAGPLRPRSPVLDASGEFCATIEDEKTVVISRLDGTVVRKLTDPAVVGGLAADFWRRRIVVSHGWGLRIINLDASAEVLDLPVPPGTVEGAVFLGDGSYVVASHGDRTMRLLDVRSGRQPREITRAALMSPACQFVAPRHGAWFWSIEVDRRLRCWRTPRTDRLVAAWENRVDVANVQRQLDARRGDLSADGKYYVNVLADNEWIWAMTECAPIRVVDVLSGGSVGCPMEPGGKVRRCRFSPDGRLVASASEALAPRTGHIVEIWDWRRGRKVGAAVSLDAEVLDTAISPAGDRFVILDGRGDVHIHALDDGARLARLSHGAPGTRWHAFEKIRFVPGSSRFVTIGVNDSARLFDATEARAIGGPMQHAHWCFCTDISPDGARLVIGECGSDDNKARATTWRIDGEEPRLDAVFQHPDWVMHVGLSPDGKRLVTSCRDGAIRVWSSTSEPDAIFSEPASEAIAAVFHPDRPDVLFGLTRSGGEHTVRVWHVPSGVELMPRIKTQPWGGDIEFKMIRVAARGRRLVVEGCGDRVEIHDVDLVEHPLGDLDDAALVAATEINTGLRFHSAKFLASLTFDQWSEVARANPGGGVPNGSRDEIRLRWHLAHVANRTRDPAWDRFHWAPLRDLLPDDPRVQMLAIRGEFGTAHATRAETRAALEELVRRHRDYWPAMLGVYQTGEDALEEDPRHWVPVLEAACKAGATSFFTEAGLVRGLGLLGDLEGYAAKCEGLARNYMDLPDLRRSAHLARLLVTGPGASAEAVRIARRLSLRAAELEPENMEYWDTYSFASLRANQLGDALRGSLHYHRINMRDRLRSWGVERHLPHLWSWIEGLLAHR